MSGLPTPTSRVGVVAYGHAMQSGRQQGQQTGCVVARGAVHDDPPPGRARAEGEGEMTRWLNFGTAAFAFAAAVFWFLSASGKLPELQAYWDKTPADDPFYTALIASAKMNRIAALFSGLSALCARCECIAAACLIWLKIHPFRGALGARPALHRPPTARIAALRFDDRGLNLWKVAG
jgi:hypothetical protein